MPKPKKKKRKKKTSIYLSPEQLAALKKISDRTQIPMARLLRKAVDAVISTHKK
jgi:predicted DNA-binding protein